MVTYLLSNLGMGNMKRGDGYMDAFEPILTKVPWLPVIGNHEYYDGSSLYRYVNQTDYEAVLPAFPSPATASLVRETQPWSGPLGSFKSMHALSR